MCKNLTNIFHLCLEELGHVITSVICPGGGGWWGGEIVIYLGKKGIVCLSNVNLTNISIFWKKKSIFLCCIIDEKKKKPPSTYYFHSY
jgi:hypothetical protein